MGVRSGSLVRVLLVGLVVVLGALPGCAYRDTWQKPEHVIGLLEIAPGSRVADIGAGDGYFIPYLAEAVGPDGIVYAVDVEEEKAEALQELVADRGLPNVKVVLAPFDDPSLPDGEIDLVILVNTYHHIEDRERYFANIRKKDLARNGRVVVIEPDADKGGIVGLFVLDDHASSAVIVEGEMDEAGYRLTESHRDDLPSQIFEVFGVADLRGTRSIRSSR